MLRTHTSYSRTSPPSQPRPQRRTRQCIRKNISAACFSEVHSTALLHTHLCTLIGTPSWLSGKQHSPAAFGNNLLSVPLDKRFLEKNKKHKHFKNSHCKSCRVTVNPQLHQKPLLPLCNLLYILLAGGMASYSLKNTSFWSLFFSQVKAIYVEYKYNVIAVTRKLDS